MEHSICPVRGLDCKLTDYSLSVRYKKLSSSQIYFWPGNTWYIHCVYWGSIKKIIIIIKIKKIIIIKPIHLVSVMPIVKD